MAAKPAILAVDDDGPVLRAIELILDGRALRNPKNRELAEATGMSTRPSLPFYDLVIVGAGPVGMAAAVYGAARMGVARWWRVTVGESRYGTMMLAGRASPSRFPRCPLPDRSVTSAVDRLAQCLATCIVQLEIARVGH